jgi:hypothetical protein
MRAGRRCRTVLLLTVMAALCLALGSSTAWATEITLSGGEDSLWIAGDDGVIINGGPQGGFCDVRSAGSGAYLEDAALPDQNGGFQGDAFDCAAMVWVGDRQYGGVGDFTTNEVNFRETAIAGLGVQMSYRALSTQSTLRVLLRLSNSGGPPVSAEVAYVNNFGSDAATMVTASSDGDLAYTTADRWIVTDDSTTGEDPANTSVFYGPGSPRETPTSANQTVFTSGGTEGSLETFSLVIEPGTTQTLMFFQQLNPTSVEAAADAAQYDSTPPPGHPLTEGMTPADFGTIVNWDYGALSQGACSDGVDNDGDGRVDHPADRQCESPSDPSEFSQCSDSLDNDDGGGVDYPEDAGCRSARDNSESPNPQCSDAVDNDGDGASDSAADPGCTSPRDNNEANAACADGVDNDGDGRTDYPDDPGCRSRADNSESPNPQCSDGADNDGDGRTDYPDDPGCRSVRDNSEAD